MISARILKTAAIALAAPLGAAAIAVAASNAPDDRGGVKDFTVSGELSGTLYPGLSRALPLTIANPNAQPIVVTALTVAVQAQTSKPGCDGTANLAVTQSTISATTPLTIPKRGAVTLPAGGASAPAVLMRDLARSQDACRGATFTFTYTGSAHS